MRPEPGGIIIFDLLDVMGNVALLPFNPTFEADFALLGMLKGMQPYRLR